MELQSRSLTEDLRNSLDAMYRKVVNLGLPVPKGKNKAERQARQMEERDRLRAEIDQLVPRPPFKVADNGAHEYVETSKYLLFRNHGDPYWQALMRKGDGWAPLERERGETEQGVFIALQCDMDAAVMLRHVETASVKA